jgi:hypothetical protein
MARSKKKRSKTTRKKRSAKLRSRRRAHSKRTRKYVIATAAVAGVVGGVMLYRKRGASV